jgi:recombination protein RecR
MNYPSRLIEEAVNAFSRFPGIGRKSALRLTLYLLRQPVEEAQQLARAIHDLRSRVNYCSQCHNISDEAVCRICANKSRDHATLCVVADLRDVMAIENTGQYNGLYHVLGGLIAPMEGISPDQLKIQSLLDRLAAGEVKEILLALSATLEGDTTAFYISKKLQGSSVRISTIARGIAIGGELEYADELTLGRSILNRIPFGGG